MSSTPKRFRRSRFWGVTKKMIGKAKRIDDMYVLKSNIMHKDTKIYIVTVVSLYVWHKRLGHPSNERLISIRNHLNVRISKSDVKIPCSGCPLAKQRKLPFHSMNIIHNEPFGLIHCDIWGPFHVPNYQDHRYFVTIVDDHYIYTLGFLIKNKSDVQQVIPRFYSLILNQFNKSIKVFHLDNAKELEFTTFFHETGILHQKS